MGAYVQVKLSKPSVLSYLMSAGKASLTVLLLSSPETCRMCKFWPRLLQCLAHPICPMLRSLPHNLTIPRQRLTVYSLPLLIQ